MAKRIISVGNINEGGIADSRFRGMPNSVAKLIGLDVHSEPGVIIAHQKLSKEVSANAPSEFCKTAKQFSDGNTYFFSSTSGKIWQRTSAGVYSLVYTTVATNGSSSAFDAAEYGGYIYWISQNYIHRIQVGRTANWSTYVEPNWQALHIDVESNRLPTQVLSLNGVNEYVSVAANLLARTGDNTFTFSAWVKVSRDSTDVNRYTIWGCNNTTNEFQIELGGSAASRNVNRICIRTAAAVIAETNNDVFATGEWFFVTYVRTTTGANSKIYVNGVDQTLITNAVTNFTDTSAIKYIGARTTTTQLFPGEISQVRVYDSALTAANVLALYKGQTQFDSLLVAEYLLNGSATDTGGANNGTLEEGAGFEYANIYIPHMYTLATAINEAEINRKYFVPREPVISYLGVNITDKGTGNWTFAIHDLSNNVVSTTTITNANLIVGQQIIDITDATLEVGTAYHLHVTTTVANGYMLVSNSETLQDMELSTLSSGDSEFHPVKVQNGVLYIGDRNYIHQVARDSATGIHVFSLQALDFARPLRAKCLGLFSTDLVIGTYIDDQVTSTLVLRWNTWSVSYSVSDTIPEQGVNAFIDGDNYLLANVGRNGRIYHYDGERLILLRDIPGSYSPTKQAFLHPNASANFKGLPLLGLSNIQGNPTEQGVYSWGSRNSNYPQILGLDYPISQRSGSELVLTNIEIGAILVVGDDLYVCWRDNTASVSGVDKLDYSNKLSGAYLQTRPTDPNKFQLNTFNSYYTQYINLPSSTDIMMRYKTNYDVWNSLDTVLDASRLFKIAKLLIQAGALELEVKLTCSSNDSPTIKDIIITGED